MGYIISPRIKSLKADIKQELKSHDFNKEPFFQNSSRGFLANCNVFKKELTEMNLTVKLISVASKAH